MTAPLITDRQGWLDAWRDLAVRLRMPDVPAALHEQIERAVATSPHQHATAHSLLASLSVPLNPDEVLQHTLITLTRAELYAARGEFDEAWGQLRKLLTMWERTSRVPGSGDASSAGGFSAIVVEAGMAFAHLTLAELELARGAWTVAWPTANEAVDAVQVLEDPIIESRALRCRARVHLGLGNTDRALKNARRYLEMAEKASVDEQMLAHLTLAEGERARSEFETANQHLATAVSLADSVTELTRARVATIRAFARQLRATGQYSDGCGRLNSLAQELRDAQATVMHGLVTVDLAAAYLARGHENTALTHAVNALGMFAFLGHREGEAAASQALGEVFTRLNLPDAARPRFERALDLREAVDDHLGRIETLTGLARLAHRSGALEETEGWLLDALEVAEATGGLPARASLTLDIGRIARAGDHASAARERFEEALALRERIGDTAGQAAVQVELAVLAEREGHADRSEEHLRDALRTLTRLGDDRARAGVLLRLGEAREKARDYDGAYQFFVEARDAFDKSGDEFGAARALKRQGDIRQRARDWASARKLYEEALPLVERLDVPDHDALRTLLECLGATTFAEAVKEAAPTVDLPPPLPGHHHAPIPPTVPFDQSIPQDGIARSRDYFIRSLEISRKKNDIGQTAATEGQLGILERAVGRVNAARELLTRSAQLCRQHGRRDDAARAFIALAMIEADAARERERQKEDPRATRQRALDHFREAWGLGGGKSSRGAWRHYLALLHETADDHRARKEPAAALRVLRVASELALERDDANAAAEAAEKAGEMMVENNERTQAVAFFERARELRERARDELAAGEVSLRLARLYLDANRPELVRIAAWKAKASFDRVTKRGSESGIDIQRLRRASDGQDEADEVLAQLPTSPSTDLLERLRGAIDRHRSGQISDAASVMRDVLHQAESLAADDADDPQLAQAASVLVNRVREFLVSVLRDLGHRFQEMGHTGAANSTFQEALSHIGRLGPGALPDVKAEIEHLMSNASNAPNAPNAPASTPGSDDA